MFPKNQKGRFSFLRIIGGFICLIYLTSYFFLLYFTPPKNDLPQVQLSDSSKILLVMWWPTLWAGLEKYPHFDLPNYLGTEITRSCDLECTVSFEASKIQQADGVIFDVSASGPHDHVYHFPPQMPPKYPGTEWIMFSYETDQYFPLSSEPTFLHQMDLTATFAQNSTVPISFMCPWGGESLDSYLKPLDLKGRKGIAFVASNCDMGGAAFRTAYVKELMKYITIDSYGKCFKNTYVYIVPPLPSRPFPPGWDVTDHGNAQKQKIALYKQYKFVLTFENYNLTDYVTEKLPTVYLGGALPIYMGAPNIDEWTPGPDSLIKTSDFKGPKELAQFLEQLDQDDDEYQKFFAWKAGGLSKHFRSKYSRCVFGSFPCRLCAAIQKKEARKALGRGVANYLAMDGWTHVIRVPRSQTPPLQSSFSIALWIRCSTSSGPTGRRLVDSNRAGEITGYNFDLFSEPDADPYQTFLRLCCGSHCYVGNRPILSGVWTHVALTYEAGVNPTNRALIFYVNGEADQRFGYVTPITDESYDTVIGGPAQGNAPKFEGDLDNVFLFRRALSHLEVQRLMFVEEADPSDKSIVFSFSLNEGHGRTVSSSGAKQVEGIIEGDPPIWRNGESGKPLFLSTRS